jgi:hypothetical protein
MRLGHSQTPEVHPKLRAQAALGVGKAPVHAVLGPSGQQLRGHR